VNIPSDGFNGDNAALVDSIKSLLALDDRGVLVPNGVCGLARQLLESAAERLKFAACSPPGTGSDSLDCILGVGGFASFGPLDAQPAAHLTIPGALEWDGDNGTHGADGESRAHGESEVDRLKERAKWLEEMAASNGREYEKQLVIAHDLRALSVTNILMAVVPGDGSGHEVYAKSVDEVVNAISLMDDKAEALEGEAVNLRAQLANTEQSRRSFFDLSQDLEKRLAERDDPCSWSDAQILEFLGVALRNVDVLGTVHLKEIRQGFEYMRDLNRKSMAASAEPSAPKCCEPTADELASLAAGDYTPEELWGGSKPTCPKCHKAESSAPADDIPDFGGGSGNKAKRRIAEIEKAKGGEQ
jgi:hypothetical protein